MKFTITENLIEAVNKVTKICPAKGMGTQCQDIRLKGVASDDRIYVSAVSQSTWCTYPVVGCAENFEIVVDKKMASALFPLYRDCTIFDKDGVVYIQSPSGGCRLPTKLVEGFIYPSFDFDEDKKKTLSLQQVRDIILAIKGYFADPFNVLESGALSHRVTQHIFFNISGGHIDAYDFGETMFVGTHMSKKYPDDSFDMEFTLNSIVALCIAAQKEGETFDLLKKDNRIKVVFENGFEIVSCLCMSDEEIETTLSHVKELFGKDRKFARALTVNFKNCVEKLNTLASFDSLPRTPAKMSLKDGGWFFSYKSAINNMKECIPTVDGYNSGEIGINPLFLYDIGKIFASFNANEHSKKEMSMIHVAIPEEGKHDVLLLKGVGVDEDGESVLLEQIIAPVRTK